MRRLPRSRYKHLVKQWNKGVAAWSEIYDIIEKHAGDAAFAEWRDMPENTLPHPIESEDEDLDALIKTLKEWAEANQ